MTSRKTFIQKMTLAVAGITIFSSRLLAKNYLPKMLIVLDAVRKQDIHKFMPLTLRALAQKDATEIHNLKNESNLDLHSEHIIELFYDRNYQEIDLNTPFETVSNYKLFITGFDVAHYNKQKYLEHIVKADAIISDLIIGNNCDFLIMTSMGRNIYENEMNGIDHNHVSARECWAAYISADNNSLSRFENKPLTTKQLTISFNA